MTDRATMAFDFLQKYFPEGAGVEAWLHCNHDHIRCALEKSFSIVAESAARRCVEIAREVIDGMEEPDFEFNSDIYGPIQYAIRREFGLSAAPEPCGCIDSDAWVCFRGQNVVGMDECPCDCHQAGSADFTITFPYGGELELKAIADAVHELSVRFSASECRVTPTPESEPRFCTAGRSGRRTTNTRPSSWH